jgi:hypothetical protein
MAYNSEHYSKLGTNDCDINFNGKNIDCTDLKKRGLCLVPMSMLVNYYGWIIVCWFFVYNPLSSLFLLSLGDLLYSLRKWIWCRHVVNSNCTWWSRVLVKIGRLRFLVLRLQEKIRPNDSWWRLDDGDSYFPACWMKWIWCSQ